MEVFEVQGVGGKLDVVVEVDEGGGCVGVVGCC